MVKSLRIRKTVAKKLLEWYRTHRVPYPWRKTKDPYRVWVSEILLQQTRIPIALQYYQRIITQFPTLGDLSVVEEDMFLSFWSGIGYYRRARNMVQCAREVVTRHSGMFPKDYQTLLKLPGIGPYTAGAIRNICFGRLTPAVDGNVRRVVARIINDRRTSNQKEFREAIEQAFLEIGKGKPPGEFFQSLMELGQRICLPQPTCDRCPIRTHCLAFRQGNPDEIPVGTARKQSVQFFWYQLFLKKGKAIYYVRNASREFLKEAWMCPDILSRRSLESKEIRERFKKEWGISMSHRFSQLDFSHSVTFRKMKVRLVIPKSFRILQGKGKWLTDQQAKDHHTSSVTLKIQKAVARCDLP